MWPMGAFAGPLQALNFREAGSRQSLGELVNGPEIEKAGPVGPRSVQTEQILNLTLLRTPCTVMYGRYALGGPCATVREDLDEKRVGGIDGWPRPPGECRSDLCELSA
jgi:hypothetical protein